MKSWTMFGFYTSLFSAPDWKQPWVVLSKCFLNRKINFSAVYMILPALAAPFGAIFPMAIPVSATFVFFYFPKGFMLFLSLELSHMLLHLLGTEWFPGLFLLWSLPSKCLLFLYASFKILLSRGSLLCTPSHLPLPCAYYVRTPLQPKQLPHCSYNNYSYLFNLKS